MMSAKKTIMVVDDEPDLLNITTRMLELDGYQVHAFGDSQDALNHLKNGCTECNILVSDLRMPGINGIELAKLVRKLRPELKIVLMSAYEVHRDEWQETSLPAVDDFLLKPLRMSDLAEAIKKSVSEITVDKPRSL